MVEVGTMEESVNRDRLSELPDSLIHVILSFLSMRDVVSTTLLSKRWNNLWTTLPCLRFCEVIHDGAIERFRNFINHALLIWNGTKIVKLKIYVDGVSDSSVAYDMGLWIRFAVKYKVEKLKIRSSFYTDDLIRGGAIQVPECLYSCSSVRKLLLTNSCFRIRRTPSWNQLKSLKIHGYRFSELSINRIMLGSPQLEVFELCLGEDHDNLSIVSTSLKKLVIRRDLLLDMHISSLDYVFRICCPNLEIFQFYGFLYGKCLFTDLSSLIDATLHFDAIFIGYVNGLRLKEMFGDALRQVFSTRVEKVALSNMCARWCAQVVHSLPKKYLLSPSVEFLKIAARNIYTFDDMMDVLGIFPNLKMLVIEDLAFTPPNINAVKKFKANISYNFVPSQLKTVEITTKWSDVPSIIGFIELLLKHAIRLEKLVFRFGDTTHLLSFHISEKLLNMPRSSPTAKVILMND